MKNYEYDLEQETQEDNSGRYYTHSIVSYATFDEISPLLAQAKHWAYILHDRDIKKDGTPRDEHYHILATFSTQKSFNTVRKMVVSNQNTFSKHVIKTIGNIFTYFLHATDTAIKQNKQPYNIDEIIVDNEEYWRKQSLSNGEPWKGEQPTRDISNDEFINDLLSPHIDAVKMAKKYGRDFIKNYTSYMSFRATIRRNADMDAIIHKIIEQGAIDKETGTIIDGTYRIHNGDVYRLDRNTFDKFKI